MSPISNPPPSFYEPFSPTRGRPSLAEWKVEVLPNGTIDPTPPPHIKFKMKANQIVNFVYRIKHKGSDTELSKRYIGSSMDGAKRFTGYKSALKKAKEQRSPNAKTQKIVKAILRSPKKFKIAIVSSHPGISESELREIEEDLIEKAKTLETRYGYNQSRPTQERLRCKNSRKKPTAKITTRCSLSKMFEQVAKEAKKNVTDASKPL